MAMSSDKQVPTSPPPDPPRLRRESSMMDIRTDDQAEGRAEVDDLTDLVQGGDTEALQAFLRLLHPADMADLFEVLDWDHWPKVLDALQIEQISDLMEELPDHLRDDLAELLKHDELTQVIEEMASDDAADVLAALPQAVAQDLLESLPQEDREEVATLLAYPEDTAGGLMQTEAVVVPVDADVDQAVEILRAEAPDAGDFHFIYVVDPDERLVGLVRLETLILARPGDAIRDLMEEPRYAVSPDVDQEQVAWMFRQYDLISLAVLDDKGRLLGRILHDDVVDVIEEEAEEDMLHMAGASPDEPELVYTDRLFKITSVRLPWLVVSLSALTIPALLIGLFQASFPQMLALIPFIPVIGAMGGNVGTQTTTIVVRGFANGRVDFHNLGRVWAKEVFIGAMIGITCGLFAGALAMVWHKDYLLSLAVALSMAMGIISAATLGVLVPFFFRLIKIDPAIAAGPAVTTINDIVAIAIYYGVAMMVIAA